MQRAAGCKGLQDARGERQLPSEGPLPRGRPARLLLRRWREMWARRAPRPAPPNCPSRCAPRSRARRAEALGTGSCRGNALVKGASELHLPNPQKLTGGPGKYPRVGCQQSYSLVLLVQAAHQHLKSPREALLIPLNCPPVLTISILQQGPAHCLSSHQLLP